jgi:hypothetical protein
VLHVLTDRHRADDAVFAAPNTVELRVITDADGRTRVELNGWPTLGARTR